MSRFDEIVTALPSPPFAPVVAVSRKIEQRRRQTMVMCRIPTGITDFDNTDIVTVFVDENDILLLSTWQIL